MTSDVLFPDTDSSPFAGNAASLSLAIGIDLCEHVLFQSKCGANLTPLLPFWVLQKTFDFSSVCV